MTPISQFPETRPWIQVRDTRRQRAARRARMVRCLLLWIGVAACIALLMILTPWPEVIL